jgi:protein-disulfide isomerase
MIAAQSASFDGDFVHFRLSLLVALLLALVPSALRAAPAEEATSLSEISKADFFVEGLGPVRKSGPYDVTIVYFMDYQCPSCRKYTPDVARVLAEDHRIRVIYRDTPLLGPKSDEAARAAIASHFQGRHEAFHHALMMTKGSLDEVAIRAAAQKAGVDWTRLQRDLKLRRDEIDMVIARNFELAMATGIQGTPAFIVGESQSNGALNYELLKAEIAGARKGASISEQSGQSEIEEPTDALPTQTEKSPKERQTISAANSSTGPIFRPAQSSGQELVTSSDGAADEERPSKWPVTGLLALFAAGAAWMWARARSTRRSTQS